MATGTGVGPHPPQGLPRAPDPTGSEGASQRRQGTAAAPAAQRDGTERPCPRGANATIQGGLRTSKGTGELWGGGEACKILALSSAPAPGPPPRPGMDAPVSRAGPRPRFLWRALQGQSGKERLHSASAAPSQTLTCQTAVCCSQRQPLPPLEQNTPSTRLGLQGAVSPGTPGAPAPSGGCRGSVRPQAPGALLSHGVTALKSGTIALITEKPQTRHRGPEREALALQHVSPFQRWPPKEEGQ